MITKSVESAWIWLMLCSAEIKVGCFYIFDTIFKLSEKTFHYLADLYTTHGYTTTHVFDAIRIYIAVCFPINWGFFDYLGLCQVQNTLF